MVINNHQFIMNAMLQKSVVWAGAFGDADCGIGD